MFPQVFVDRRGCWIWTGKTTPNGYGSIWRSDKQRRQVAHRFYWESLVGPIPASLEADHLCRQRLCVNPAHLEMVTRRENQIRGTGFVAHNARKTQATTRRQLRLGTRRCQTTSVRRRRSTRHTSRAWQRRGEATLVVPPFAMPG
jgi:hypothetical protein